MKISEHTKASSDREQFGKCPLCGESYYDVDPATIVTSGENEEDIMSGMIIMCVDCFADADESTIEMYAKRTADDWAGMNDWSPTWEQMKETVSNSVKASKANGSDGWSNEGK